MESRESAAMDESNSRTEQALNLSPLSTEEQTARSLAMPVPGKESLSGTFEGKAAGISGGGAAAGGKGSEESSLSDKTVLDALQRLSRTSMDNNRTVRLDEDEIDQIAKQVQKPASDSTRAKISTLLDDPSAFFGETGRITRTIFDKRKDVDQLIEANSHLRTHIRKEVETGTESASEHLSFMGDTYDIVTSFAEGGQGTISSAVDRTLNRLVAIKALKKEFFNDIAVRNSFIAEAKVTAQLDHPSIVPIYSLGKSQDNGLFLAMKLINGQNFKDYLDQICTHYKLDGIGAFDEHKSLLNRLEIFLRVCEAMEYAHSRNVMHRDLKPENIMIGEYHETYVMDWGIARLIREPGFDPSKWERPKQISGTPRFLSPEAINGEYCDHRADIFTLGLILFEAVTLKPAFSGNTSVEVMSNIKNNNMEKIEHRFRYRIDRDLKAIIQKATAYDREKRYQHVSELADDLRKYINGAEVSANPDNLFSAMLRWMVKHRKSTLLLTFFLLFLGACGIAWTMYEKMGQAIDNRLRDAALSDAYAKCVEASFTLDRQIARLEQSLASTAWETAFLLNQEDHPAAEGKAKSGKAHFPPVPPYTVYTGEEASSRETFTFSPVYAAKVDFDSLCYQIPTGADQSQMEKELRLLAPLKQRLTRLILESPLDSDLTIGNIEDLKKEAGSKGMPVYWAYLSLKDGLQLCFPGNGQYSSDYDARKRNWYRSAEKQNGLPVWGAPYRDTGSMRELVITCSMAIMDMERVFYGVMAIDVSVKYFTEMMNSHGNRGNFVIEKFLLDGSGGIIAQTSGSSNPSPNWQSAPPDVAEEEENSVRNFPDRLLFLDMRRRKFGVNLRQEGAEEVLYVYSGISSLGWIYVEKLKLRPLLEETFRHQEEERRKQEMSI